MCLFLSGMRSPLKCHRDLYLGLCSSRKKKIIREMGCMLMGKKNPALLQTDGL